MTTTKPPHIEPPPGFWEAALVDCPRCDGAGAIEWDREHGDGKCHRCRGEGRMLKQDGKLFAIYSICGHAMRSNRVCIMDPGHRGRHASSGFRCDGCNKMRRSQPSASDPEAGDFCFMCASPQLHPREWWP